MVLLVALFGQIVWLSLAIVPGGKDMSASRAVGTDLRMAVLTSTDVADGVFEEYVVWVVIVAKPLPDTSAA